MTPDYTTQDGDMIDAIAFERYPGAEQSKAISLIYAANRGLAALGPILPAGVGIVLPDMPAPRADRQTRIWG